MRSVLITADDFGWTDAQNRAVALGAAARTLHRASLLANGGAFSEAVAIAEAQPALGVGVHLTLVEGRPLSSPQRLVGLCDAAGHFFDGPGPLLRLYLSRRLDVSAVAAEWRAQVERVMRALGPHRRLSHLDGHKHLHLLPPLFDVAIALCREYGVRYLRVPAERPGPRVLSRAVSWVIIQGLSRRARRRLRGTGLVTADHFVGFGDSGAMNVERLLQAIRSARPGLTEIMLHPAAETAGLNELRSRYAWARRYRFNDELSALCHPEVATALSEWENGCSIR